MICVFGFDNFLGCKQQSSAQELEGVTSPAPSYLFPAVTPETDKPPSISPSPFSDAIHKTGIKIHPAAVRGGFPLDSFPSESSECEGVEKQPAVLHVSRGSGRKRCRGEIKTDISTVSGAMLPVLSVGLENRLFSCFVASSVAPWQW